MLSFLTVVSLIQRDTVTVSAQLVESFSSDLLTFLTSNNPTALQSGIVALDKTAFGKKVRECLKTCNIPSSGFAGGAISGIKWKDQSSEVTAPILESHARIVDNFTTLLSSAGLFEKKVQSEEKKAESKAKREEKAASALASEVAKLGLVDPLSIPELGVNAKLDCVLTLLASGLLDSVQLKALMAASIQALNSSVVSNAWLEHCTDAMVTA